MEPTDIPRVLRALVFTLGIAFLVIALDHFYGTERTILALITANSVILILKREVL
jgi:hypothetical protein